MNYGKVPVPYSVGWSDEARFWLAPCQYAGGMVAIHQEEKIGGGKPTFGKPHMNRQRRAIALCLCDVCGKPLKVRTKVSMSEERAVVAGDEILPTVVEPLCCRPCARLATQHCPHLKSRVRDGLIIVRQVFTYRIVAQLLTGEATAESTGESRPGTVGHLKMQLTKSTFRDLEWLEAR